MKFYETTYIAHSALQAGRLDDLTKSINDKVKAIGGEILFSESWGRKKLAYLIDKQKYGTYVFFQFKITNTEKLNDLVQEFEINSNILRHLIVAIEENKIKEKIDDHEENQEVVSKNTSSKEIVAKELSDKIDEKTTTEEVKSEKIEEDKETTEEIKSEETEEDKETTENTENKNVETGSNNEKENLDKE